ncbi:MAG: dehydrogenase, partial [Planctomycetaceae bacterium]|nr:dehydrogenase [Planctomycetaceae bacterium]
MKYLLNLFLVVVSASLLAATVFADDDGFVSIFDGKTLEDWDGNPGFWRVEEGAITGQTTPDNPTKGNTFIIWRGGEIGNFELKLQYRIVGGNSGIQYRSFEVENNKWVVGGYQGDFEAGERYSGILYGERFRGILADRGDKTVIGDDHKPKVVGSVGESKEIQSKIKKEDWNDYHITAQGFNFTHRINGVVTCECADEDAEMRRKSGILALQLHAGPPMKVQFRNIRLKQVRGDAAATGRDRKKKVVFVAGTRSHGYGSHEHYAGCVLLAKSLQQGMPDFEVEVVKDGWPEDADVFEGADAIVMYADGGERHPVIPHLATMDKMTARGVGVVCIHYGVEVPRGEPGDHFLKWIGGYFEMHWSVNPHWTAKFDEFPDHAITRGVKPFEINDEWYYHMRFREEMEGVTPILTDLPGPRTLVRPDGTHSGNPHVRAAIQQRKEPQHVAWAALRPDGGRGFGFTGGHNHWNWGDPNFRKLVLNAIVWCAKGEVPNSGVGDSPVTLEKLEDNQDYDPPENFNRDSIRERLRLAPSNNGAAAASRKTSDSEPSERLTQKAEAGGDIGSRDPAEAVSQLDVHAGLKAKLFAAEPMIHSVSNIDIDHRGRVWVCDVVNYRRFRNEDHPGCKEGDRILILEDTNGDGRADRWKVFYQGSDIDSAHGVCVLPTPDGRGTKTIVSAGANVFVLTDQDGDDRADKKDLLFTGIGGVQHDHGIHAFVFGPDGKLYFNFGNMAGQIRDKHGNPITDTAGNVVQANRQPYQEGMVFRCNLDGSEFETLGWNFRNNWMVTVDSFGTLWQSDNDDDGTRGARINYVMEFGNYGY